jgi:hypothetical protein
MEMDTTDLIARARAGDHNAFRDLLQGHSHELQVRSPGDGDGTAAQGEIDHAPARTDCQSGHLLGSALPRGRVGGTDW